MLPTEFSENTQRGKRRVYLGERKMNLCGLGVLRGRILTREFAENTKRGNRRDKMGKRK
jgi:hypothetical protein